MAETPRITERKVRSLPDRLKKLDQVIAAHERRAAAARAKKLELVQQVKDRARRELEAVGE